MIITACLILGIAFGNLNNYYFLITPLTQEIKDIRNTFKEACRCCDRIKEKDKIIIDDTDLLLKRLEEIKKLKQQQQIKKLFEENK